MGRDGMKHHVPRYLKMTKHMANWVFDNIMGNKGYSWVFSHLSYHGINHGILSDNFIIVDNDVTLMTLDT